MRKAACVITDANSLSEDLMDLLLQADPSKERIESYFKAGRCRIAHFEEQLVGTYVLILGINETEHEGLTAEIVNISIAAKWQGRGFGKELVIDAIELARASKASIINVGTGNSSINQLGFYQKCGFRIIGIDFDFFTRNYSEPIIENGIACRDLILLTMKL
jgi:ribosomal protein S18 acetylase RimI-like enzyme